ncbi:MAG: hypothetical protein QY330_00410 [Candidatus Dojkabacteria bacterium]|uniref:Uncharacterized protein n=2 Tax=Candidatus Dojkabacteria TaxID=74243 RepID=A0A136KJQ3_9BACT|nr:MAG: hypothetical protein UZ20_WS6002000474 [candidate division WS6 bacterium OLB21]MBW7954114.1 hypothetical protein [Candidatus Dojkabacteria bacterium]WKZ28057.1 MAG: hypothetical protein QY330_00410 [Candidatus Dojkabacteria bacterium]
MEQNLNRKDFNQHQDILSEIGITGELIAGIRNYFNHDYQTPAAKFPTTVFACPGGIERSERLNEVFYKYGFSSELPYEERSKYPLLQRTNNGIPIAGLLDLMIENVRSITVDDNGLHIPGFEKPINRLAVITNYSESDYSFLDKIYMILSFVQKTTPTIDFRFDIIVELSVPSVDQAIPYYEQMLRAKREELNTMERLRIEKDTRRGLLNRLISKLKGM